MLFHPELNFKKQIRHVSSKIRHVSSKIRHVSSKILKSLYILRRVQNLLSDKALQNFILLVNSLPPCLWHTHWELYCCRQSQWFKNKAKKCCKNHHTSPKLCTEFSNNDIKITRNHVQFNAALKNHLLSEIPDNVNCTRLFCHSCSTSIYTDYVTVETVEPL